MRISLIGMSGTGKTYWSKKFEAEGFTRYSIDDLIEEKLEKELAKLDHQGIQSVAKWMGQPFQPHYKKASKTYLTLEEEAMKTVFALIENESKTAPKIVIDTTGSLIYLPNKILLRLAELTKVIYFKLSRQATEQMYDQYLREPKPVIWGSVYKVKKGEDKWQSLARCYPKLLEYRAERYEKLAQYSMDVAVLRDPAFTAPDLIKHLYSLQLKQFSSTPINRRFG